MCHQKKKKRNVRLDEYCSKPTLTTWRRAHAVLLAQPQAHARLAGSSGGCWRGCSTGSAGGSSSSSPSSSMPQKLTSTVVLPQLDELHKHICRWSGLRDPSSAALRTASRGHVPSGLRRPSRSTFQGATHVLPSFAIKAHRRSVAQLCQPS